MSQPGLLHIIDGSGYIYRAYYAIRSMTTSSGEATNAVYGFTTMIQKFLDTEKPEYVAMVFDVGRHTFRNDIYPEYKANRDAPPEDLPPQIDRIHQVTDTFRIPRLFVKGFEADDVIATLTRKALDHGFDVRVITGDKDLMQLVDDRVTLFEPMSGKRYQAKEVEEKLGVLPGKVVDYLALCGDTSDNVPGVRGVGPKTATRLLAAHDDLEGVLAAAAAGKIKGKIGEKIAAAADDARLSRRLVTLRYDVPVEMDLEAMRCVGPDVDKQRALFEELEFKRLLSRQEASSSAAGEPQVAPTTSLSHDGYRLVTTEADLEQVLDRVRAGPRVGLSLEYDVPRMRDASIRGVAVAWAPGEAAYIPVGHDADVAPQQLSFDHVLGALKPILSSSEISKAFTAAKPWYALAQLHDFELRGVGTDISLASYLINAEDRYEASSAINHGADDGPHGAGDVARKFLNARSIARSQVVGRGRQRVDFAQIAPSAARNFVAERADIAIRTVDTLDAELSAGELTNVMTDLELPLVPILAGMELQGIRIDVDFLEELAVTFTEEIRRAEKVCHDAVGYEFKINSPKALRTVLFEDLGLKIIKRTKTGPSTDQSVLEELSSLHELPRAVLEYRSLTKLQSTYIEALPRLVSKSTGRVHTTLSQTVAATGRLSSLQPNLQNIPVRTEIGRQLRKAFIPDDGYAFISVDYSQIELRVLAHLSREPVLLDAFREHEDIHTRTASVLFEVGPDAVTREQRTQAKAVNFGVLYGMGPVRLARQLQLPRRTASGFIKDYFEKQPGVRALIDDTLERAKAEGFVRTLLGRRRWVPDIESRNRGARAAAERVAVNAPIQGSAADLIKLAMIRVSSRLADEHPDARLLLQVHDELLLSAPADDAEAVADLVKREMESAYPLEVPLVAAAHVGSNWDEAH